MDAVLAKSLSTQYGAGSSQLGVLRHAVTCAQGAVELGAWRPLIAFSRPLWLSPLS